MFDTTRLPGDVLFFQRRGAKEDQFKLYVRRGLQGQDQLLFDPELLKKKTGKSHAINYYAPSPDGKRVAVGVSAGGSEDAAMRILDTRTGRQLGPDITRAQFGAVSWTPDGQQIFFHRMQLLKKGMPSTDKNQRSSAVVMKPGGPESSIRTVLTAGLAGEVNIPATEFAFIDVRPDGRVLAQVIDGVSPEFRAYHSPLAQLRAALPDAGRLHAGIGRALGRAGPAAGPGKLDPAFTAGHLGWQRGRHFGGHGHERAA